jgi:hypothetical protein
VSGPVLSLGHSHELTLDLAIDGALKANQQDARFTRLLSRADRSAES